MTLKLEIGKTYRNRKGGKVKIVATQPRDDFPYVGEDGSDYRYGGRFNYGPDKSSFDLVEECKPDAPEHPKPEALPLCEAICGEIVSLRQLTSMGSERDIAYHRAENIIHKHFAALSVEEVAKAICEAHGFAYRDGEQHDAAQAVLRLLRRG